MVVALKLKCEQSRKKNLSSISAKKQNWRIKTCTVNVALQWCVRALGTMLRIHYTRAQLSQWCVLLTSLFPSLVNQKIFRVTKVQTKVLAFVWAGIKTAGKKPRCAGALPPDFKVVVVCLLYTDECWLGGCFAVVVTGNVALPGLQS